MNSCVRHAFRMVVGVTLVLIAIGGAEAVVGTDIWWSGTDKAYIAQSGNVQVEAGMMIEPYEGTKQFFQIKKNTDILAHIDDDEEQRSFDKFYVVSDTIDKINEIRVIIQFYDEPVLSYAAGLKAELMRKQEDIATLKQKYSTDIDNKSLESQLDSAIADLENKKMAANAKIEAYKDNILNIHLNAKNEIKQNNLEIKITREYTEVFNGLAAEVLKDDIKKLKNIPSIKAVYSDQKVYALLEESVPLINATKVWQMQNASGVNVTGKNVKVAILDTGIDYTHPDLGSGFGQAYKVITGWDIYNNDPDPMDDNGHGTHVAGIVAANGSLKGVAPDAQLMAYKVLGSGGSGSDSDIIAGIEKAVDPDGNPLTDDGADIISMSLGGWGDPDDPLSQAVDNAVDYGVVAVVAAGNSGPWNETISSPGTARKAITVGAATKQDSIASFSSRGPVVWKGGMIVKPDVVSPGVSINSTVPNGSCALCSPSKYNILSGTSMATPMVAGTVALLIQKNRSFSPVEIKMALRGTAKDLSYDINTQGYGRIDAFKAASLESAPPVAILNTSGIVKETINITGTALGTGFTNYTVEYGNGSGTWLSIGSFAQSVNDSILIYGWDTTTVSDGDYFLRLTVRTNNGSSSEDQTMININNVELNYPLNNDIFRLGDVIEINGTIRGAIENYNFEYGRGYEPTSWLDQGINITYPGSHNTTISGILATWNTSSIIEAGFYTLRITVYRNTSVSTEYVRNIYFDPILKKGWPIRIDWDSFKCNLIGYEICYYWGGSLEPTIKDIDNDGLSETIVYSGGVPPKIYVFNPDGSPRAGFPVNVGSEGVAGGNLHIPLVSDTDNDGLSEIIAFNYNSINSSSSELYIFKPDGSLMNGQPALVPRDYHPTLLAADLNNDSRKEIVVQGNEGSNRYLTIMNANGTVVSQWRLNNVSWGAFIVSSPAIGNFDDDPDLEIVSASPTESAGYDPNTGEWNNTGVIYIFNLDGSNVSGWPVYTEGIPFSSPAVGDINNDGSLEIVVGLLYSSDVFPDYRYGGVYVFNKNGTVMPGWPFMKGYNFWSSPSLADFNGDGALEIATSSLGFETYETYVLYSNATLLPGWPQHTVWNDYYSTVAGDINDDGVPEIITTAGTGIPPYEGGGVYAWNVNGTILSSFPRVTEDDAQAPAALGDIDNNGRVDILASSDWDTDRQTNMGKQRGTIYAWEMSGSYNSQKMPWPTFHHDTSRTGLYNYTDFRPGQITGEIVNEYAVPLPGATVTLYLDKYGNGTVFVPAVDINGIPIPSQITPFVGPTTYTFTQVPSGIYKVTATLGGKSGFAYPVIVTSGTTTANVVIVGAVAPTTISIASQTVAPGGNVTVPIMAINITNVAAYSLTLSYNSSVVVVDAVTAGDLGDPIWNNSALGTTSINAFSISPQTGNVVLANVVLRAVGTAGQTSPLVINVTEIVDSNGIAIPVTVLNGTFTIQTASFTAAANRTNVSIATSPISPTPVEFTVMLGSVPVSGATVTLSGAATGTGITTTDGKVVIMVSPTRNGTIVATATHGSNTNTTALTAKGDVNGDNRVSITDALFIAQYTAGLRVLDPNTLVFADVSGDGRVSITDALFIAQATAGIADRPVPKQGN